MHPNAVKAKLRRGECVYGTSLEDCLSPEMPVVLAAAGLDFFFVDTEHSPASYSEIQALCRTAHDRGIVPLVRVTENLPPLISRALDVGASGVIVPRLKSAEEVRAIVKCVKFSPLGERGFGLRSVNTDLKGGLAPAAIEASNRETMVVAMIETREAVEAVEKIAAVKGVDALFIGPYDLSLSLGILENFDSPIFWGAVDRVLAAAKAEGIAAGAQSRNLSMLAEIKKRGGRFLITGSDVAMLLDGFTRAMKELKGSKTL
jgi:2-keto-3-deoxy-L-rhamnonate aldolase RhmA